MTSVLIFIMKQLEEGMLWSKIVREWVPDAVSVSEFVDLHLVVAPRRRAFLQVTTIQSSFTLDWIMRVVLVNSVLSEENLKVRDPEFVP